MQKEILLQMLEQNQKDCSYFCKNINAENIDFRLTEETASVGFIYRHIGETTNLIGQFFGYETTVEEITLGHKDTGKHYDLETSRLLFEQGYVTFEKLVNETSDKEWFEDVETAWFGKISRIKLFFHWPFFTIHIIVGKYHQQLLREKNSNKITIG